MATRVPPLVAAEILDLRSLLAERRGYRSILSADIARAARAAIEKRGRWVVPPRGPRS